MPKQDNIVPVETEAVFEEHERLVQQLGDEHQLEAALQLGESFTQQSVVSLEGGDVQAEVERHLVGEEVCGTARQQVRRSGGELSQRHVPHVLEPVVLEHGDELVDGPAQDADPGGVRTEHLAGAGGGGSRPVSGAAGHGSCGVITGERSCTVRRSRGRCFAICSTQLV